MDWWGWGLTGRVIWMKTPVQSVQASHGMCIRWRHELVSGDSRRQNTACATVRYVAAFCNSGTFI